MKKYGNYEFELKGVQHNERLSDDSECFSATLYVNGTRAAECRNGGYGGPTDVDFFPHCEKLEKEIEEFLKTVPKEKSERHGFEYDVDLEIIVGDLLDDILEEKHQKKVQQKMERMTKDRIVYKVGDDYFTRGGWKGHTIESLLKHPQGPEVLRKAVAAAIIEDGGTLINKNIPAHLMPGNPAEKKAEKPAVKKAPAPAKKSSKTIK